MQGVTALLLWLNAEQVVDALYIQVRVQGTGLRVWGSGPAVSDSLPLSRPSRQPAHMHINRFEA